MPTSARLSAISLTGIAAFLSLLLAASMSAPAQASAIIIDDGEPGTSSTGSWCVSAGSYGPTSRYSCGSSQDTYTFKPSIPVAGAYNVYVRYRAAASRSTTVPFSVVHSRGTTKLTFNQTLTGEQWVLHGLYRFSAGTAGSIYAADTNGQVSVDGVMLVPTRDFMPANYYFGRQGYVEYVPGTLPIIFSVPHDGALYPSEIPDRVPNTALDIVTTRDSGAYQVMVEAADELYRLTGQRPHMIRVRLARTKLDASRTVDVGANGNWYGGIAWSEYHNFLEIAKHKVNAAYGRGQYVDFHSHGHSRAWIELGYGLSSADLALTDDQLDASALAAKCSIFKLIALSGLTFSPLLRGTYSFGGFLGREGRYEIVPGPAIPSPGGFAYYAGGYDTVRHGSSTVTSFLKQPNTINAIQIEAPVRSGSYGTTAERQAMGRAIARALRGFVNEHYRFASIL